jgi:hypothetical protein
MIKGAKVVNLFRLLHGMSHFAQIASKQDATPHISIATKCVIRFHQRQTISVAAAAGISFSISAEGSAAAEL